MESRKCVVTDDNQPRNAIFHYWSHYSKVIDPSPMVGGHTGGVIAYPVAVCEEENGKVFIAPVWTIEFD